MSDKVTNTRWDIAQNEEKKGHVIPLADMVDHLYAHKIFVVKFLAALKDDLPLSGKQRILEIGGGPTCIFLALREGEKYAFDPTYEHLFGLYPTLREIEEYKDVIFISSPIEKAELKGQFDLIFTLNSLDHVAQLKPIVDKIDELLCPSGKLVIVVDCYADSLVSKIMRFFDIDLPHPHHFIAADIAHLFSNYKLVRQDLKIFEVFDDASTQAQRTGVKIYRIDKYISKMMAHLKEWGKENDIFFILKSFICYDLTFLIAYIRRREIPVYPLKKPRLFIFQKQ